MDNILFLRFKKSRSSRFKTVLSTAKSIPGFHEQNDIYSISISNIYDFCAHRDELLDLMETLYGWKDGIVLTYGRHYKNEMPYYVFFQRLTEEAGKYAVLLNPTCMETVTIEDLPEKVVYYPPLYGAFFGFAEDVGTQIYFCECERKAIDNYFIVEHSDNPEEDTTGFLWEDKVFPKAVIDGAKKKGLSSVKKYIQYREGLCFRCNRTVPKKAYCHPMYGGQFMQNFGWYVNQEYYCLGISRYSAWKNAYIAEECPPALQEALLQIKRTQCNDGTTEQEKQKVISSYRYEINRYVENSVREKLGYKRVGEGWVSETIMFQILEGIFGKKNVIRHFRPDWLNGLELDAYIPAQKTGFEYQGIQHFKAVKHWGGEEKLKIQQEHDDQKKKICKEKGVRLICINYNEPLTKDHIQIRLSENGI